MVAARRDEGDRNLWKCRADDANGAFQHCASTRRIVSNIHCKTYLMQVEMATDSLMCNAEGPTNHRSVGARLPQTIII